MNRPTALVCVLALVTIAAFSSGCGLRRSLRCCQPCCPVDACAIDCTEDECEAEVARVHISDELDPVMRLEQPQSNARRLTDDIMAPLPPTPTFTR